MTSKNRFGSNPILIALVKKLGTQNYHSLQTDQTATVKLSFAGPLQAVTEAIDFGKVEATDESTRTITVTIPWSWHSCSLPWRSRLSDISWWMRALAEPIARRSNIEV